MAENEVHHDNPRQPGSGWLPRRALLRNATQVLAAASLPNPGLAVAARPSRTAGRKRPNILYLHSHDTGRWIQLYGHRAPTPNLQRLAEQGVVFRRAFSAAPTCSPSRAALLTGQCPHSCGMLGLANHNFSLEQYEHHLARTLQRAGYTAVVTGVQHILKDQSLAGWDRMLPWSKNKDIGPATGVVSAVKEFFNERLKEPFFLAAGFFETHRTFRKPGPRPCTTAP